MPEQTATVQWFAPLQALIQDGAVHLHLAQTQELFSRDDYVNVAAVHPVTLELSDTARRDTRDHSTPDRRSRNHLVNLFKKRLIFVALIIY